MRYDELKSGLTANPCECKRFDDLGELVTLGHQDSLKDATENASASYAKWIGRKIANPAELAKIVSIVWNDGMDMLDAARDRINRATLPTPKTRRRRACFDEFDGDDICLDRLRDGAPFWRTTRRDECNGPTNITIAVSINATSSVKSDAIIWRGIAAITLAELLEASGYRVAIVAFLATREAYQDSADSFVSIDVKRTSDPLDVVTLVNSLSGWFMRSAGFGGIAMSRQERKHDGAYGYPTGIDAAKFGELYGESANVLIDNVWDEFAAVELIESTLAKLDAGTLAA